MHTGQIRVVTQTAGAVAGPRSIGDHQRMSIDSLRAVHPDLPPLRAVLTLPGGTLVAGWTPIDADDAAIWWRRLRSAHAETGLWPVIIAQVYLDLLADEFRQSRTWRSARGTDDGPLDAKAELAAGVAPELDPTTVGRWPGDPVAVLLDDEEDEEEMPVDVIRHGIDGWSAVDISVLPARAGWEVPYLVGFGGFNECPEPFEHAAILHRWEEMWGAELFAMGHDTLEFEVSRPPTTREDALQVALEHMIYNESYSPPTLAYYAAMVIDSPVWVAWWD